MEDCFEIVNLSNCTDEATSCTVGCWAAQRNTNPQTGRSKTCEVEFRFCIKTNLKEVSTVTSAKTRSFVYIDMVDVFLSLADPYN